MQSFKHFFIFSGLILLTLFITGGNPRCFTVPACWIAPGPTAKIWTNKYYEKRFTKTDTLLSTKYITE
jgi:hypothetical protein